MKPGERKHKYSVLFVESDPGSFTQIAKLLSKRGYILYVAENGQVGLRIYKDVTPDIVITEIGLPFMNGLEMATQIRALNAKAQIILTTAHRDTDHFLDAINIGITAYLLKPVDTDSLFAALDKCMENVKAERELQELTERTALLSSALEQSPSAIAITDTSGNIEYVNPKFTELTGYWPDEVIGQNVRILKSGKTPPEVYSNMWGTITAGREWEGEIQNKNKDGKYYWEELKISPLRNLAGTVIKFIKVAEDVTGRKRTEDEIRKLNSELEYRVIQRNALLEASNKELDDFCDAVSHDLRGPLSRLQGFSHVLLEECAERLDVQGKLYVERINQTSRDLKRIIDALLKLSQLTRRGMAHQNVDLSGIAHAVADGLIKSQPERCVDFVIAPDVVVKGDSGLLKVVLENLLGNAWKFTSKHQRARIEFGVARTDNKSVYFVRDDGAGFDMKYANKLFKPFQRIHSSDEFSGTGLGLASVQRIIQRHGGRIWVEGEVEKGATFYFTVN
ncbi:MAG: multi-sensor signal transduction histidine [Geobacteraceae bacterium]|nr:MAG: multi-sensor signal transduction histidine [Geobacteraceae bacterium]